MLWRLQLVLSAQCVLQQRLELLHLLHVLRGWACALQDGACLHAPTRASAHLRERMADVRYTCGTGKIAMGCLLI